MALDFTFKSQFPIGAVMQAMQQKAAMENEANYRKQQLKQERFNALLNALSTGASIGRSIQQGKAETFALNQAKQEQGSQNRLAYLLGNAQTPMQGPLPMGPQQPGMSQRPLLGEQADYPDQLRQSLIGTGAGKERLAQTLFPDQQKDELTLKDMLNFQFREKALAKSGEQRDQNYQLRFDKAILDYSQAMEANPVLKEIRKQKIGLSQVNELIKEVNSGNTVASSAMAMKVARGLGEVGVLTDNDVTRYVQSGRLDRKAADALSRMIKGKPTNATMGEIQQISDVLNETYINGVQSIQDNYVNRLSRNFGIPPQEAASKLDVPYSFGNLNKEKKKKSLADKLGL